MCVPLGHTHNFTPSCLANFCCNFWCRGEFLPWNKAALPLGGARLHTQPVPHNADITQTLALKRGTGPSWRRQASWNELVPNNMDLKQNLFLKQGSILFGGAKLHGQTGTMNMANVHFCPEAQQHFHLKAPSFLDTTGTQPTWPNRKLLA